MAVAAMRAGASDFVQKPIAPDRLLEALDRVTGSGGPQGARRPLTEKLRAPLGFEELIGSSPTFRTAPAIAAKAARASNPVISPGPPRPAQKRFPSATQKAPR